MTKKKGVRVAILVEDRTLERFARRVLEKLGFARHELRVVPGSPNGRGSGKQSVDLRYPIEVQAQRREANNQNVALLVGTDADNLPVGARAGQLADALHTAQIPARDAHERIVHWIPKWSIETWLLYLRGDPSITEDESFKDRMKVNTPAEWNAIANRFATEYRSRSQDTLPSLSMAYTETQRID